MHFLYLNVTTAANISKAIVIDLKFSSAIALCSLTSAVLVVTCSLVFLRYFSFSGRNGLDARTSYILLFLGALLATISAIAASHTAIFVYRRYLFSISLTIGLVFNSLGAYLFFESFPTVINVDGIRKKRHRIGHKHENMGIIIWLVTLPLAGIELFLVLANLKKKELSGFYIGCKSACFFQKLAQASIYYFSLRFRFPISRCPLTAQWYFLIMSFVNFILWIDAILLTHEDDNFVKLVLGQGFWILKATYNALGIDYRLMCCMLFMEHAIDIDTDELDQPRTQQLPEQGRENSLIVENQADNNETVIEEVTEPTRIPVGVQHHMAHYTGTGYIIGLVLLGLQIMNGIQYMELLGSWASVAVIFNDLFVVVGGTCFMKLNNLEIVGKWRESDSRAIDATVGIMGGVGFIFLVLKFILIATMIHTGNYNSYIIWCTAKSCIRAISALFQLYLFVRVPTRVCAKRRNRNNIINHFLVPALTLSLLAVFASAIVDEYHGKIEQLLEVAELDPAVKFLLKAGSPIHLGFSLHMCLHFLIIHRMMTTRKAHITYLAEDTSASEGVSPTVSVRFRRTPLGTPSTLRQPLIHEDDDTTHNVSIHQSRERPTTAPI